MEYLDFELSVTAAESGDLSVAVIDSPAGQHRERLQLPFEGRELEMQLKDVENALLRAALRSRRAGSEEELTAQRFGLALRRALLTGGVGSLFDVSRQLARRQQKRLRVRLRADRPDLAGLPWEFLYDEAEGEFLALLRDVSFVRYLELPKAVEPLVVTAPLRLLCMASTPSGLPELDVARERRLLDTALAGLKAAGLISVQWLDGQSRRALHDAMVSETWHLFHFVGHGDFDPQRDEGLVHLADEETGRDQPLTATQLGRLLGGHDTRLAFLNCCEGGHGSPADLYSSVAATLVRRGIPAVVAMQYPISDEAAIEFARTFYGMIARRRTVDEAVAEARIAVSLVNRLE